MSYTCDIANRKFNEFVQKAKANIASNNFILASDNYENAIKIASDNQECSININAVSEEKLNIVAPATYQKFINKIAVFFP